MFLRTKSLNESSLTFKNLLAALRTEVVKTEVQPIVVLIFNGFSCKKFHGSMSFFQGNFCKQTKDFFCRKHI